MAITPEVLKKKPTGLTDVEISLVEHEKQKIGSGQRGTVYRMPVIIGDKRRVLVAKEYSSKEHFDNAVTGYELLKEAGAKTLPTFRFLPERQMLLMTNGNADGRMIVTNRNASDARDALVSKKLHDLEGFPRTVRAFFSDVEKLSQKLVVFQHDALFFSVKDDSPSSDVQIYFGDTEGIFRFKSALIPEQKLQKVRRENMEQAVLGLLEFLEEYVQKPAPYMRQLVDLAQDAMVELNLPNGALPSVKRTQQKISTLERRPWRKVLREFVLGRGPLPEKD